MANTITNLIPLLYEALDVVSREMVGFIPAVNKDTSAERAAKDQTINIFTVPAISGSDVTPGQLPPDDGDQTFGNTTMTISKSRYWPVRWTGEEGKAVGQTGLQGNVLRDQFAQAMRAACNEIESDLAALHGLSSRAYGTAGTAPFGSAGDLSDLSFTKQILEDNGAPTGDLQFVLSTGAKANLGGKQSALFKVNEAGTSDLLRRGIIGQLEGFDMHTSGQVKTFTKGTNSGATTNATGYAIGAVTITLASAGTGTILAGDVITFAGDTNKYVVLTGDTDVSNGGTIVLAEPGLRQAIPAGATAITTAANSSRNMAFSRSAIALATRLPALPDGGDSADDRTTITDPVSGLSFEISLYRLYRRIKYEVAIAWGVKMVAPRHTAILLG